MAEKNNERNAGRTPNYKGEIVPITRRVPKDKIEEIDEAIGEICEPLLNKKENVTKK
jgi:hypothetical protein